MTPGECASASPIGILLNLRPLASAESRAMFELGTRTCESGHTALSVPAPLPHLETVHEIIRGPGDDIPVAAIAVVANNGVMAIGNREMPPGPATLDHSLLAGYSRATAAMVGFLI